MFTDLRRPSGRLDHPSVDYLGPRSFTGERLRVFNHGYRALPQDTFKSDTNAES